MTHGYKEENGVFYFGVSLNEDAMKRNGFLEMEAFEGKRNELIERMKEEKGFCGVKYEDEIVYSALSLSEDKLINEDFELCELDRFRYLTQKLFSRKIGKVLLKMHTGQ